MARDVLRVRRAASLALGALCLLSCSPEPESPEARVRALLARAERAAEDGAVPELKELVSRAYADGRGNDRQAIAGLLTYHFLRHRSIHLLTRVHAIAFPEPTRSQVTVFVAMAGQPIPAAEALSRLKADLYRFDFALAEEEGQWRVTRADWRRAEFRDFL